MSVAERIAAMVAGELTYRECCYWAQIAPEEVPLVNGEFAFLACFEPEAAEAVSQTRLARPARWTEDLVIERLHAWVQEHGEPPRQYEWNPSRARRLAAQAQQAARAEQLRRIAERWSAGGWPSEQTVRHLFGRWDAAIAAAGYPPRGVGRPRGTDRTSVRRPAARGGSPPR
jgi:hypothetical protein